MAELFQAAKDLFVDSVKVCLDLFKVMIPIIIAVKILKETGLIQYFAIPLEPLMELVGLPAQTGLVWATALINNLYGGIVVYLALIPDMPPLTVAQVTVMCTMMLIAHGLPIEAKITQKCGVSFWGQVIIRFSGALACGALMNLFFNTFNLYTQPAAIHWNVAAEDPSVLAWMWGETVNLGAIFCIILALMGFMRILNKIKITDLLIKLLGPVLKLIGIGKDAATITIFGLTMGIVYGGGLIIHEAKTGNLSKRDIFSAVTLMGLCHSLIEDTLLMMLIGAHFNGVFWGRLIFALVVMAIVTRLFLKIPGNTSEIKS